MTDSFVCDQCGCVDNIFATQQRTAGRYLCSECQDGHWHGNFPKEAYDPEVDGPMLNRAFFGDGTSTSF